MRSFDRSMARVHNLIVCVLPRPRGRARRLRSTVVALRLARVVSWMGSSRCVDLWRNMKDERRDCVTVDDDDYSDSHMLMMYLCRGRMTGYSVRSVVMSFFDVGRLTNRRTHGYPNVILPGLILTIFHYYYHLSATAEGDSRSWFVPHDLVV
jgi:hypothetical protein